MGNVGSSLPQGSAEREKPAPQWRAQQGVSVLWATGLQLEQINEAGD